MEFKNFLYRTKRKLKKSFKKLKKSIKRYIRFLVRHTKAGDYRVLVYSILAVIMTIIIIVLLGKGISSIFGGNKKSEKTPTTEVSTPVDAVSEEVDPNVALKAQAQTVYATSQDFLILVNGSHALDAGYTFTQHTLNSGEIVDERIYQNLALMLGDLNAQDLHYTIISGYRSREAQQVIVDTDKAQYIAAGMSEEEALAITYQTVQKAGYSEHETGLAVDIVPEGVSSLDTALEADPTLVWLAENCTRYGFILRYPKDKEAITGITYEPWHFRYVGVEAATFMKNNNLTLEEFTDLLQTN